MNTRALAAAAALLATGCTAAGTTTVDPAAVACHGITHAAGEVDAAISAHTDATASTAVDANGLSDSSGLPTATNAAAALKRLAATTARPPMDGALGAAIEELGSHATSVRGAFIYPTRPVEFTKQIAELNDAKYTALGLCERTSR